MRCRKACAVLADGATAEVHMTPIPDFVRFVFVAFVPCFTAPTLERFILLALAAIITTGSRTVNNLLRTLGSLAYGHPGSYHHLFSSRRWLCWRLARSLATLLVERFVPSGVVHLVGGRHCVFPSWAKGLRQGPPSRRCEIIAFLYCLSLWP